MTIAKKVSQVSSSVQEARTGGLLTEETNTNSLGDLDEFLAIG